MVRTAKLTAVGAVEIADSQIPVLGPTEARLTVTLCGLCGSDLHMLEAAQQFDGQVLGHEFTGVITELGDQVSDEWKVGDRVVVRPVADCGECDACRSGTAICWPGLMSGPGLGRQGGLAESVTVPVEMLFRVPDSVSDTAAAIVEPLAVAVRAVERSTARAADAVCVLGGGPIGYMCVVVLKARGTKSILVVEPNNGRVEKVRDLGVETCTPGEATEAVQRVMGRKPRVVIDCTGHPSGGELGITLLPQGGHLAVVGITAERVAADFRSVARNELTITGSLAYSVDNFQEALDHLAAGRVPVDNIVTSVRPLEETNAAMRDLGSGNTREIKVLLRP